VYNATYDAHAGINTTANLQALLNSTDIYSRFNTTYASFAYNMTTVAVNITNDTYGKFWYNMTASGGITLGVVAWDNSSTQSFIRTGFPLFVNVSNTLFVNDTSGNVGIGIANLTQKLTLAGNINFTATSPTIYTNNNPGLTISNQQSNIALTILRADGRGHVQLGNDASLYSLLDSYGPLEIRTNAYANSIAYFDVNGDVLLGGRGARTGTAKVAILNETGNVGIGTVTPATALHVLGNVSLNSTFYLSTGGLVGIGTSAPTKKLDVSNGSSAVTFDPTPQAGPIINTTGGSGNLTITSAGGSVIITLG
jgi:hypothetical protein